MRAVLIAVLLALAAGALYLLRAGQPEARTPSPTAPAGPEAAMAAPNAQRLEVPKDEREGISPPGSPNAVEPPATPRSRTELQARADEIRDLLRKVRHGEDEEATRCYVQTLIADSVATILDLTGQSQEVVSGKVHKEPPGTNLFVLNGREYRFQYGEFPEYDAFQKLTHSQFEWMGKRERNPSEAGERPTFSEDFLQAVETRANEVLVLIGPPTERTAPKR